MKHADIVQITDKIRYKSTWHLHAVDAGGKVYLQWSFYAPDYANKKAVTLWPTRKHYLSPDATESEIVQTAFYAAQQAEEHECREAFSYDGDRPFQPHININALREASRHPA